MSYEIKEILNEARTIWGSEKLTLSQIIVLLGKDLGDICRWERNSPKDKVTHTDEELMKELGNIIVSTIRWCDDLSYDPEDCIAVALRCQNKFPKHPK